jgi:hypothetical protein
MPNNKTRTAELRVWAENKRATLSELEKAGFKFESDGSISNGYKQAKLELFAVTYIHNGDKQNASKYKDKWQKLALDNLSEAMDKAEDGEDDMMCTLSSEHSLTTETNAQEEKVRRFAENIRRKYEKLNHFFTMM